MMRNGRLILCAVIALLEAYSKEKNLEEKQLCNAEKILQKCVKQGMYFAFFRKLPVSVLSPYQLDDKTFVEYHADPSCKGDTLLCAGCRSRKSDKISDRTTRVTYMKAFL